MIDCSKGAEWRKWDLHLHTPGTAKNDQFGSDSWVTYISTLDSKDVSVLGITDYFSIENFLKVKEKQDQGSLAGKFLIPNIELRILPVTRTDTPINLHVLFDPSAETLALIEREFFRKLKFEYKDCTYSCIRTDLISLGRSYANNQTLDEFAAWKVGVEQFNIPFTDIRKILENEIFRDKYLVGVSNSSNDGNSGIQHSSLAATREEIYRFSDFILSGNPKDREFFLGKGSVPAPEIVSKYGSLKPCIVGSDAHCLGTICSFPNGRITWIKADPSFEGLKQIILEPEERVYIGDKPPLFNRVQMNRTRFITGLSLRSIDGYSNEHGKWFENVEILFNKELVAIIGNKGSGKSAIADIIALCSSVPKDEDSFVFLNKKKFCVGNGKLAQKFTAKLKWESGYNSGDIVLSSPTIPGEPGVKYLSQGQFERLTNELSTADEFQKEIESVVFSHIPDSERLNAKSFSELKVIKTHSLEAERLAFSGDLKTACQNLVILERKRNPQYKKDLEQKLEKKNAEFAALKEPDPVADPNSDPQQKIANAQVHKEIDELKRQISGLDLAIEKEELAKKATLIQKHAIQDILRDFENERLQVQAFIKSSQEKVNQANLDIHIEQLISFSLQTEPLILKLKEIDAQLNAILRKLGEAPLGEDEDNPDNLHSQRNKLQANLEAANAKLDGEQKKYQDYLNAKEVVAQERKHITGSPQQVDSVEFYKAELAYLSSKLSSDLDAALEICLDIAGRLYQKSAEIVSVYKEARNRLNAIIAEHSETLLEYKISIDAGLVKSDSFMTEFLGMISKQKSGTFNGTESSEVEFKKLTAETDFDRWESVKDLLVCMVNALKANQKSANAPCYIEDQVKDPQKLFEYLFSVTFVKPNYQLKQGDKTLDMLSPGERGALLLVFYLLLDKSDIPLIIDQPEDNLDNHSVATVLVPFIRRAKSKRQIIMVTHNPNLAVVSDAEQVIYASINKDDDFKFSAISGSIENPVINKKIVDVLEGAMKAFNTRKSKYF